MEQEKRDTRGLDREEFPVRALAGAQLRCKIRICSPAPKPALEDGQGTDKEPGPEPKAVAK